MIYVPVATPIFDISLAVLTIIVVLLILYFLSTILKH